MKERIEGLRKLLENRPDWKGTVLRDDLPEWAVIQWEKILGVWKPPYIPTFERVTVTDGQFVWPLGDSTDFATEETTAEMAKRYGDNEKITTLPAGGQGGIFTYSHGERHIHVKGILRNAGQLASYFQRMPEDTRPGLADQYIRRALGLI